MTQGCAGPAHVADSAANGASVAIQTWRLDNGARAYFVPAPGLPMVDIRVVFDAGSARDGDKPGLARLTNLMLEQGAGGDTADALALRLESLGAQLRLSARRDTAVVDLRSLTDPALLEPALNTLATILTRPDFPQGAFERERQRTMVALQDQAQSPSNLAQNAFYRGMYPGHPYAEPELGNEQSVPTLRRGDVRGFHQRYYVGSNALNAIVGDLDRNAAEMLAQQVMGSLPAGEAAPPLPPAPELGQPKTLRIAHPSQQTHILVGQPGVARGDPDYFALYLGNHILGGSGFGSRVVYEVREQRGLSYSAYTYFSPMRVQGPFIMGLQTRTDQATQAQDVLMSTLRAFVEDGPTAKELRAAKDNITGGWPLRVASNRDIVGYIAAIGFYGLPLDYLDQFPKRIEALTAEQVRDAFRRHVDAQRWLIVVVGNGEPGAGETRTQ
ncbi:MAG: zinc protease [Gammaproteobacteria bacterium SG8_47]|nr:MAG: zinc protease [Gammaproteobacteria bacterium SG8_47]